MERSVHMAERELHSAQRTCRTALDGTARCTRDQASGRCEFESHPVLQERRMERQGSSPGRRLYNGSRVSFFLSGQMDFSDNPLYGLHNEIRGCVCCIYSDRMSCPGRDLAMDYRTRQPKS